MTSFTLSSLKSLEKKKRKKTSLAKKKNLSDNFLFYNQPFLFFQLDQPTQFSFQNVKVFRKFLSTSGKILSRERTSLPLKKQRKVKKAIKVARFLGLLRFACR